jgi:hypothetical protein
VLRIRIRKNPKYFDGSESEKNSDSDPIIRGGRKNVSICCNFHKQKYTYSRVITLVRTSILSVPVHLHEKQIADTLENLYFLYHLCRILIGKKILGSATLKIRYCTSLPQLIGGFFKIPGRQKQNFMYSTGTLRGPNIYRYRTVPGTRQNKDCWVLLLPEG